MIGSGLIRSLAEIAAGRAEARDIERVLVDAAQHHRKALSTGKDKEQGFDGEAMQQERTQDARRLLQALDINLTPEVTKGMLATVILLSREMVHTPHQAGEQRFNYPLVAGWCNATADLIARLTVDQVDDQARAIINEAFGGEAAAKVIGAALAGEPCPGCGEVHEISDEEEQGPSTGQYL